MKMLETFRTRWLAAGADEVLVRHWQPGQIVERHSHAFTADAMLSQGEMWLTCGGEMRHLTAGDTFHLAAGEPHSEKYGPAGATYWVARKKG
jgi:quercetin dioxygenase-like cupin family protein